MPKGLLRLLCGEYVENTIQQTFGLLCCDRSENIAEWPDHNMKSFNLHIFMSCPVRKCHKRHRSQLEQKVLAAYASLSRMLGNVDINGW